MRNVYGLGFQMNTAGSDCNARANDFLIAYGGQDIELVASMAPLMSYCIEQFGPKRCMFESNFPVDKVSFSHPIVFNAFKRFSQGYSAAERAAMFHDTAVKAYRIGGT